MNFAEDYDRLKTSLCVLEDRLGLDREDLEAKEILDACDIGLNDLRLSHRAAVEELERRVAALEAAVQYQNSIRGWHTDV